jgi:hypothetical protein
MKYFNECDVSINSRFGTGIVLVQNATINVNRSINSTYVLGRQNSSQMVKTKSDETNIDFSYFINIEDPIFKAFEYLKTGVFTNSFPEAGIPLTLKVAGISGLFYPSNFSLSLTPNSKVQASVGFSCFSNLSGYLLNKSSINNLNSGSGIAHSWNARVSGNLTEENYNVLDFNYSINVRWDAIYSVGKQRPAQVNLSNIEETFDYTIDDFNSDFSNSNLSTAENSTVYINTFGQKPIFNINTSGSKINSSSLSNNLDDFAKNKISLKRTF